MTLQQFINASQEERNAYAYAMDEDSQEYCDLTFDLENMLKEYVNDILDVDELEDEDEAREILDEMVEDLAAFDQTPDAIKFLKPFYDNDEAKSFSFLKKTLKRFMDM